MKIARNLTVQDGRGYSVSKRRHKDFLRRKFLKRIQKIRNRTIKCTECCAALPPDLLPIYPDFNKERSSSIPHLGSFVACLEFFGSSLNRDFLPFLSEKINQNVD